MIDHLCRHPVGIATGITIAAPAIPHRVTDGNGAMGGVVNIVTKPTTPEWHGSWNTYMNAPQHRKEGSTKRLGFMPGVNVLSIGLGFTQITPEIEADTV
jgi:hypothetical protein